jgi:sulfur relay (sulfurtransferase) DsrF/TusC family protein
MRFGRVTWFSRLGSNREAEMARSVCILVRRAPYGTMKAAEALRHLNGAVANGLEAAAVLVEDGVYLARDGHRAEGAGWTSLSQVLRQALTPKSDRTEGPANRIRVYAHRASLERRGFRESALVPGVELISDQELARVVGEAEAFLIF